MPEGARPAVLQPHGHPHLAHRPVGPAGRGPLPQRPADGAPARRVLRGPLRASSATGWPGSTTRPGSSPWSTDGEDLYPRLRLQLDNPETLALEPVRFELMRRFGYFVTESSGHASEYLPYFRKRPDLLASLVETFESAGSDYSAWFGYGQTGG